MFPIPYQLLYLFTSHALISLALSACHSSLCNFLKPPHLQQITVFSCRLFIYLFFYFFFIFFFNIIYLLFLYILYIYILLYIFFLSFFIISCTDVHGRWLLLFYYLCRPMYQFIYLRSIIFCYFWFIFMWLFMNSGIYLLRNYQY